MQASQALRSRDYQLAILLYQRVLAVQPRNVTAWIGVAQAHLLRQELKPARAAFAQALRLQPENQTALTGMGETLNLLGQYVKAEGYLQRAHRNYPRDAAAAWALSRTYFYEGRYGHARGLLEKALALHPDDYRLWESLGETQLELGHNLEAAKCLRQALALNPKAKRSELLLDGLRNNDPATRPLKAGFHNYTYRLSDGVGNQVMTFPQTLNLALGGRWKDQFTGEYRRVTFQAGGAEAATAPEGVGFAAGSGGALSVGIVSFSNSASFKVNDELTLTGGGGTATYLALGMNKPLYDAGFKLTPFSSLQLSLMFSQSIVAPTELAARLGITERGWSSQLRYQLPAEATVKLAYYQQTYSDSNQLRGGSGAILRRLWQGPVQVSAGYRLESLSFSHLDFFNGYFDPKRYIANSAVVRLRGQRGRFHIDYDFDAGQETYTRPVIQTVKPLTYLVQRGSNPRFIATLRNTYQLSPQLSLQFSGLFFRSALSTGTGAYQAYAFLFGLTRQF